MDEIKRALLGDKEAQRAVTDRGELLPCPFCGSKNTIISNWGMWRGWCQACLGKSDDQLNYRDALKSWNTRPQLLTAEEMERLEGLECDR